MNFVFGFFFSKITVNARVYKCVVAFHGLHELFAGHGYTLVFHLDLLSQCTERGGTEEKPIGLIGKGGLHIPFLSRNGIGIKNGPNGTAPIVAVSNTCHCCVEIIFGIPLHVLGIQV